MLCPVWALQSGSKLSGEWVRAVRLTAGDALLQLHGPLQRGGVENELDDARGDDAEVDVPVRQIKRTRFNCAKVNHRSTFAGLPPVCVTYSATRLIASSRSAAETCVLSTRLAKTFTYLGQNRQCRRPEQTPRTMATTARPFGFRRVRPNCVCDFRCNRLGAPRQIQGAYGGFRPALW